MASRAVATQQQGGAVATREPTEYDRLRSGLERRAQDFKMALPAHISPEKFQRTVMTAAQSNPELLKADRGSLITACMKAAQDGLLPDGREAAIVTFNNRKQINGQWETIVMAQYMPMVFGLRKKILQSGEISSIETNVVYRAEVEAGAFIFEAGTEAMLRHRPSLDLTDEDLADENIVAAYSVATMKDGTKSFEVMRRAEINKVRQTSKTGALGQVGNFGSMKGKPIPPKGPWVDWFAEMARKTVMRRHSKTLPMSGDLIDVEAVDEAIAARSATALLASVEPDASTVSAVPPTRDQVGYDPETGEVDEDTARALDAQTYAAAEGRTDEQHGDQHDGDDAEPAHPFAAIASELTARADRAETIVDVNSVDAELGKHRDAAPEDLVKQVDDAIEARRAALKGGK